VEQLMPFTADYITAVPREQQEDRRKIRCFSGRYINPLKVRAREICLEDIAHHLSQINRYTGASPWPLSVAQHSVMCAERAAEQWDRGLPVSVYGGMWRSGLRGMASRRDWIAAHLLHDAGEYLFNDLASPVKRDPRMAWYREAEHQTTRLMFCVFGLDPALLELTKPLDDAQFFAEARTFWKDSSEVIMWTPREAETAFHRAAQSLNLSPIWSH
jgi:hypothetical protein